jgi:hypothetical protein
MALDNLKGHLMALMTTVIGGGDPPPAAAIDLFNRLLEEARSRLGPNSLVHEIPDQGPDTGRGELLLWANQLLVAI